MEMRRYVETDAAAWDRFVETSVNGTLMHTRRFLAYHSPDAFADHSLLFASPTKGIVAVFPAAEVVVDGNRTLRSHPGSSYGGLVIDDQLPSEVANELVGMLVAHAIRNSFDRIWMRLTEGVFHRRRCGELDAELFRAGFQIDGRELSSAVRLEGLPEADVLTVFRSSAQRAVRKAVRVGIVARPSDDFADYWRLLERNLDERHGVRPTHSLEEILRLRAVFPDQIVLVAAYRDDRLVAGTVLFMMNSVAAHTMYMAQDYEFQEFRALNLVLHEAIVQCLGRGMSWLNYGISSIPGTGGREMNNGLYAFKRSCGGEGVVRDLLVKNL